ncbi:MAG: hypothetical protein H6619_04750 [Deltaproteobacteria bacterium]|nr:hypothetical protein [Deltaproteobacteria bacterium]
MKVVLAITFSLLMVANACADSNAFEDNRRTAVQREFKALSPKDDETPFSVDDFRYLESSLSIEDGAICDPGDPYNCDDNVPGERQLPVEAFLPPTMRTHSDLLNSRHMSNLIQNNLNSEGVVQNVTLFLTESAVAQGVSNTQANAFSHQTNMLLTDMRAVQVGALYPSLPVTTTYFACLQKKFEEKFSYGDAQSFCLGDNNTTPGGLTNGSSGALGKPGLDFGMNPADVDGSDEIRLSDLIFNPEGGASSGTMQDLRDSFVQHFGNVIFKIDNTDGVMKGSTRVVKPAVKSKERYDQLVVTAFNKLKSLVKEYCDYQQNTSDVADPDKFGELFVEEKVTDDDFQELSFPGFVFNAEVWSIIEVGVDERFKVTSASNDSVWNCGALTGTSFSTPQEIEDFLDHPETGSTEKRGSFEVYRDLHMFARAIGLGQFLYEALDAENQLAKLTANIDDHNQWSVLSKGFNLIYAAAGTNNISHSLGLVISRLSENITTSILKRDEDRSKAARQGQQLTEGK